MAERPSYNGLTLVQGGMERLGSPTHAPSLSGGGGDGTSEGMEARVAVLETHVEIMRRDVADLKVGVGEVKVQLATLTERVAHLPSKGFVVTATMAIFAAIAAFSSFQQQIQHLLHTGP